MTVMYCHATILKVPRNPNCVTVTTQLQRDTYEALKKRFASRYGDVSKVLRQLVQELLSGKIKLKN